MKLADHQRQAAHRAMDVIARRGGVLLADEVGLGKSFVAAEVMRAFCGEVELLVPAALVPQWRATLGDGGVTGVEILTHDSIAGAPFVADPARVRLVVVDEAHAFRNPATQRYDALCRRTVAASVLLITATPVCNSARDLHALLSLIAADDALHDAGVASLAAAFGSHDAEALQTIVSELVIRRDRDVLPPELQFPTPDRRVVRHRLFDPDGATTRLIGNLAFPLVGSAPLLRRHLWRRLESSEAALRESIQRQLRFYDRALDSLAHGRVLTKRDYRRAFGEDEDGDPVQQILFWDLWAPTADLDPARVTAEVERLTALRALIDCSPCTKRQLLLDLIAALREPAIVFTSAAATARDLHAALRTSRPCGLATSRDGRGGIESFRRAHAEVLVATDLAGEGLNLQRAGAVIHYDIPWNPVRLDQRNGRACRIGQTRSEVIAIYFLPEGNLTGIVSVMATKNRVRRRLLLHAGLPHAEPESMLPPRVPANSAAVRLIAAAERCGLSVPEWVERSHKAGVERLLAKASGEYLDRSRLADLLAMSGGEKT